jgi:dimethylamine monooxygenase subunit B
MIALAGPSPRNEHRAYDTGPRQMRVTALTHLTGDVLHIAMENPDGHVLTSYQPGSHVILGAGEVRNAYSLTGDGLNPRQYAVSVLRRASGSGSRWLHDNLSVGGMVEVEGPRCHFAAVANQRRALLVAGGIGVTPILSHARAAARLGGSAEIVYSYRPGHAAHLDDLRDLATLPGIALYEVTGVEETRQLLAERLADQPLGAHAYACGPAAMLETYEELAAAAHWPRARVHLERFAAPEQDPGDPFEVTLASTGERLAVPAGVSLLERLLEHGVAVPNLCRQGVCGECRIPVRGGAIQHRDFVLSDDEKQEGASMLCCVSRGQDIEVDL